MRKMKAGAILLKCGIRRGVARRRRRGKSISNGISNGSLSDLNETFLVQLKLCLWKLSGCCLAMACIWLLHAFGLLCKPQASWC